MSTIDDTREGTPRDLEMPDIYPRLAYEDERAALEYLVRVFQFGEIREARTDFGEQPARVAARRRRRRHDRSRERRDPPHPQPARARATRRCR